MNWTLERREARMKSKTGKPEVGIGKKKKSTKKQKKTKKKTKTKMPEEQIGC